jgi:ATP phosphoribosyltransferase
MLRIGFAKGRGAAECMDLMVAGGVRLPDELRAGRMTVHRVPEHELACYVVRGDDLPSLLAAGYLDAAIGSSIVFDEHAGETTLAAVLEIGRCRLSLITLGPDAPAGPRLCTRYPRVAARWLGDHDGAWHMHVLHGCVEAGLFLGVCDAIADIVETGWTLRTLGLHEQRALCVVQHQVRVRPDNLDVRDRLRALMPSAAWE